MEKIELKHGVINGKKQYYVDFYHDRKRMRLVLGKNKERAEKVRAKWDLEVYEGRFKFKTKKESRMQFKEMASQYLEKHSKPNKSSWKRDEIAIRHLNETFGDEYINTIDTKLLGSYILKRKNEGISERTIDLEVMCMKNIFNKMVELEEIEKNPIAKHKLFNKDCSRVKHLTVEQLKKLYAECCDHLLPVVIMAVNTGCRKSEILNLKWKDVDFIKNKIYITNTKSGKNRFVPIANQLKETLLKIKQNTKNKNYVFCDVNGAPLGRIETAWRAACRRAGITDFRVHDLRHHYSITMVSNGMDLISLKQFLGHSSLQMVERYANYIPDRDAKAINILNSQMVIF